jgi:hypothetical protein
MREPGRYLDMKITLNNVDIEFSLGWCHKYALVDFELQHERIRTRVGLNVKAGWPRIPCLHQVHRALSEYTQCVSSSLLRMVHRRAYEESPRTQPD